MTHGESVEISTLIDSDADRLTAVFAEQIAMLLQAAISH